MSSVKRMATVDYFKILKKGFPDFTTVFKIVNGDVQFSAIYVSIEDVKTDIEFDPNLFARNTLPASVSNYDSLLEDLRSLHEEVRESDEEGWMNVAFLTLVTRFMPTDIDHSYVVLEEDRNVSQFEVVWVKMSEDLLAHIWGEFVWYATKVSGRLKYEKVSKSFPSNKECYLLMHITSLPTLRKVVLCDVETLRMRRLEREQLAELQRYFKWGHYPSHQTLCALHP